MANYRTNKQNNNNKDKVLITTKLQTKKDKFQLIVTQDINRIIERKNNNNNNYYYYK
jgi:hypothetical protein